MSVCTLFWLRQHDVCMYIGLAKIACLYVQKVVLDMISYCLYIGTECMQGHCVRRDSVYVRKLCM